MKFAEEKIGFFHIIWKIFKNLLEMAQNAINGTGEITFS